MTSRKLNLSLLSNLLGALHTEAFHGDLQQVKFVSTVKSACQPQQEPVKSVSHPSKEKQESTTKGEQENAAAGKQQCSQ